MAPTRKTPPSRPPVRAKSALPSPRVTPKRRAHVPWHQRRPVRILAGIGALVVLGLIVLYGLRFWHHHQTTQHNKTAVKKFDAQLQQDFNPLSDVFSQATSSPEAFLAGSLPQAQYVSQTAQWLSAFQGLEHKLVAASPPAPMVKARALIDQGVVVFTDAIRLYQLAGTTADAATRAALIQQGNNTLAHAEAVFANGVQEEAQVVHAYRLPLPAGVKASSLDAPPSVPEETVTVTPSPSPT